MKVGILTFHSAMNFGAVLQCHGLYKTLQQLGHDVSVIDYRPSYLYFPRPEVGKRMMLFHPIKAYKLHKKTAFWRKNYDKFFGFQSKEWKRTKIITASKELKGITDTFDVVIVGSDQVWNEMHNGNDSIWYGLAGSKARWITYAVSAGDANLSTESRELLSNALTNFSHISVRENKLANIITNICPTLDVPVVLDPTLLADYSCWEKWTSPIIEEDYIAVYQARPNDNTFRVAEQIAAQRGIKNIVTLDSHKNVKKLGHVPFNASPQEFIALIANCRCLITTSFHGTAFAIITNAPFYTLRLYDGADERVENLLQQLGLSDRMIDSSDTLQFSKPNFTISNDILTDLQVKSIEYLQKAL